MTHYNDAILPITVRFGSMTGTGFNVQEAFASSGYRKVNELWDEPLRSFRLQYKRPIVDGILLTRFYESMGGPADSFLLRDWAFWHTGADMRFGGDSGISSIDAPLINTNDLTNQADGSTTTFYTYYTASQGSASRSYRLRHPESAAFVCAFDGQDCTAQISSVDEETGVVTFSSPPPFGGSPNNAVMTWGSRFWRAAHFANRNLEEIFRNFEIHAFDLELLEARGA